LSWLHVAVYLQLELQLFSSQRQAKTLITHKCTLFFYNMHKIRWVWQILVHQLQ